MAANGMFHPQEFVTSCQKSYKRGFSAFVKLLARILVPNLFMHLIVEVLNIVGGAGTIL